MSGAGGPQRLPGPKTLLRAGAPFGAGGANPAPDAPDVSDAPGAPRDRGLEIRRALVDEIRARAAPPGRRTRRR